MPFLEPRPNWIVHPERRNRDVSAIDKRRRTGDADESSPCPHANQGAKRCLPEVIWTRVPFRPAPAVDQHDLRFEIRADRPLPVLAVAHCPEFQRLAVQELNEAIGNLTAAVKPLINNQPFLVELRRKLPLQLCLNRGI